MLQWGYRMKGLMVAFSLLGALAAPAQAQTSQTLTKKGLVDQFNAVVFIHEHGKTGKEAKPLVKWAGPIRVIPTGTFKTEDFQHLEKTLKRVARLTGLDIQLPDLKNTKSWPAFHKKANIRINFLSAAELAKKVERSTINCQGKFGVNKKFEIVRAQILIPNDRPEKTHHCLVEETVQVLGLTNDTTLLDDSIFNEKSDRLSLSVADQILLKALYDQRLKPGMRKDEAQGVVREVIYEIVDQATKRKKQN